MTTTFTRPTSYIIPFVLIWLLQVIISQEAIAQVKVTPTFNVDLSADPNGAWTSEEITRNGQLCGASANDNCVQFNITLNKNSGGLQFLILSGPEPSGSMGYQMECGAQQPVGTPICVSGPGPHKLTLCMPGNAKGSFRILSIPAFNPVPDVRVAKGCSAVLQSPTAFQAGTITWKDLTGAGKYDKYLSFPNGKANPVITPDASAPDFIDYEVCGTSQASACAVLPYCDVVRVFFQDMPVVSIGPQPAIICPGSSGVQLEGTVTGGSGNFSYIWTDSNGNQVASTKNYVATAVGTYHLEARNENYPNCQKFSSSITVVNNLSVNAGPDQRVCALNNVTLAGTVTSATGGIWSGGTGTFRLGNTALNNIYEPTAAELQRGSIKLTLTSTGNGSCTEVIDQVLITFYTVEVNITGPAIICAGTTASLTATATGADNPVYTWSSGETTATISGKTAGTYSVTVRDGSNCTVTKSFTVTEKAGPSALAATLKATTCGYSNGEINITGVTGSTAPYTYSRDGIVFQQATTFTALAAADYNLTVKDANGCTFVKTITLTNIAGPTAVAAAAQPASCKNNDGSIQAGTITGGTGPYTYAIDGNNFQTANLFTGIASGTYTLTAKDANGCTVTTPVTVIKNIPTGFTSTATASTCGTNNGQLTITGVSGGTAPYTYSKNLINYQTSATFTALTAAAYTITIKDANGCIISGTVQVNNIPGPTDLTATVKATTCGDSNGELNISGTTGGSAPYTYSLNGSAFQTAADFTGIAAGTYQVRVKDGNGCIYTEDVLVPNISGPAFTVTAQSSTCGNSNGSISVGTVSGGTAPYIYSKDGINFQSGTTFAALAAGNYTIATKDANGCVATKTITVNNLAGPTDVNLTAAASTCGSSNGTINAGTVTGGTAPYTYSRDGINFQTETSFAALLAGEYNISVKDANGCLTSKKITLTDVAGPSALTASVKASTCGNSNGELTITGVTGGTAPYSYSKDGNTFQALASFTALAARDYAITVKDANGCTFVRTFTLTNIAGPAAVAATTMPASCKNNDGRILIGTVTGGTEPFVYAVDGTNFQASTNFTGLAAGTYTVTAKDANNCLVTTSVAIATEVPVSFTSSTNSSTCANNNGQLTVTGVTGGKAPYTYSKDGTNFQASATFTALLAGSYTIVVKDANGCTFAAPVQLNNIAGPTDLAASVKASTCSYNNGGVSISGVTGGTAPYSYAINESAFQSSADFTSLLAGKYVFKVKDANGCVYTEEVVVNNIAGSTFTATAQATTCGDSNGSIVISNVLGGTAPYTYSQDGINFGTAATFNGLAAGSYTIAIKDANGCLSTEAVTLNNIAGPTAFVLATKASTCGNYNGKLEITGITGGTAPFTYAINSNFQSENNFENVLAGEYTVIVKDANGCTLTKKVTVNDIAGPTDLAASLTASTCGAGNGELMITGVTGGTAPFTYSKDKTNFQNSATFTALTSGQHTITVKDANGCTFVRTFTINNISGPTAVTAAAQPATCADNDGFLTVGTVTGGTAPYTYALHNNDFQAATTFNKLASGTYTLSAKDANGCIITTSVTVGKNIPKDFTSTTISSTCGSSNGAFTITSVTGGIAPYTYSLDGGSFGTAATFTALAAGAYQVQVKDANNCTYAGTIQINNIAGPTFTATPQSTTCGASNGSITISQITGGTAPYTFSQDGTNFQSSLTFNGLIAGEYTVVTKDANGCLSSKIVQVPDIAGPATFALTVTATTCGNNNGSITIGEITGGTAPFAYSLNNAAFQTTAAFNAVAAGPHTITVRDANGCTAVKNITLENIPGPVNLTAGIISATCGQSNGQLEVTGVTGGTAPYLFSRDGSPYQSTTTFADLTAGSHTLTVKDANGCTYAKSFIVSDIAGPTAVAATSLPATCADNDGTITAGAVTGGTAPYTYSIDGINFKTDILFRTLASGTYTLRAKDANGCIIAQSVTVNKVLPTSFSSTTVSSTCGNPDGSLTITGVTGGTAPYTYSLNGTTYQSNTTFTALAAGAHTVTVKDANGCTFTGQVQVNDTGGPADLMAALKATTCGNSNGEINITAVSGGTAPYTYSLDGLTYQNTATFTALAAGKYQINIKDANGCRYTEEVTLVDLAAPFFTATAQASTCGDSNARITLSNITGGTAPFTFSLDGVNFQSGLTFSGLAAGDYTITAKDANGCSRTVAIVLENIAGPTGFTLASAASTCGGPNGRITVSAVLGGTYPYTYAVNGVNFQAAAAFETVLAGEYTVTVKDANGCTVSKKITVNDIAGPAGITATLKAATCGKSNGELTVTGLTGGTAPFTYSQDGLNFQTSTTFTALAARNYAITVKDANNCTFVRAFTLDNIAGPAAVAFSTQPASCADNDGTIMAGTVTGGTAPYTYALNNSDFQAATTFIQLASGSYTLTAKDANGCTVNTSINVAKNIPASFTSTVTAATCGRDNGQLVITGVTGGTAPYTYSQDGTNFQNASTFSGLIAGSYTITVKDANGCTYAAAVPVNNIAGPTALQISVKATTCGLDNGQINISGVTGGTAPYSYALANGSFRTSGDFTALATGTYTLAVKDANGCVYTEEIEVKDIPGSTYTLTAQASTCGDSNGSIVISNVLGGTAPYTYSQDGVNFRTAATFNGLVAGSYTIIVKDANGCLTPKAVTVNNIPGPTALALNTKTALCSGPNGELEITGVTGGTAPYTYSVNGTNFQAGNIFTALLPGEYTVTAKDANGCIVTKKGEVNNLAGPADIAASFKVATCGSNNGELIITGVTGGTSPYLYSQDGVTFRTAASFADLAAGQYAITVKDANGCTFKKTFTLENLTGPTALAANTQPASCTDNDGRITIGSVTGGSAPYTYSINGQDYQAGTTFSALPAGNYTIAVKDANGCTVITAVKVEKNIPTSFTNSTIAATCGQANGQIAITAVTGGTAPYTYSIGGQNYQSSGTFVALASGEYAVNIKDAKGCIYVGKVQVDKISVPVFTATAQTATCSSDNGSISIAQVTGGSAPYTYSKDGIHYQAASTFPNLSEGTYNITLRDANNCVYAVAVKVGNIPGPTDFTLTSTAASCGNNNGKISFGPVTGGTAPYTYAISEITLNDNTFGSSPDFAGIAAGTYTASVKDANGCTVRKEVVVGNNSGLTNLRATPFPSACSSDNGSIIVDAVNGGKTPYTYSLDGTNYQGSAYFAALAPKAYTVYVKDANGCSTSTQVTVVTNGPQVAVLTATPAVCTTNNGTIAVTAVTGGTQPYTYSLNGTTFQASAQFTNLAPGSYTITIRDAGGCTLTRTQAVENTGGATSFTISTTAANCSGTNGQLVISDIIGGKSPYTYSLNGNSYQTNATFSNLAAGNYQVMVKDAVGCIYTQAATVTGSQPLAIPQVIVTPAGCGQNSGQVLVQNVTGGSGPYTYSLDGINFSSSATFTSVLPGRYTLSVKDAGNCSITAAVEVILVSSTVAKVKDASCFGTADGEISIAATGVTEQTEYSIDNGVTFQKKAIFSNLPAGIYQVITRFSATCTITIGKVEIKGPTEIKATVTPLTKTIGLENTGSAAITQIEGGAKPYTYQLDNGSFTQNTEFKNLSGGAHTLLVKDANGCTTSITFTIEATTDIEIPNGFTPNGDGINDTWAIKNLTLLYPKCKVTVYNRWGSLVFESVGYTWEWDGTYNTKKLPVGTYYCIIELDDTKPALKKSVTIMR